MLNNGKTLLLNVARRGCKDSFSLQGEELGSCFCACLISVMHGARSYCKHSNVRLMFSLSA
jgi:hypothetical protein